MNKNRLHVELFAGCGGMAIGMKRAGFDLAFANEVSPMASGTFALNILGINIAQQSNKIKWIHSRYSKKEYENRLRENLLTHKSIENCEIPEKSELIALKNNLFIGDARHLKDRLVEIGITDPYNGKLDLVSGGPPCQSFSLAGKRERKNYKNNLPLEFAEICEILNPRVVLLENVKGILSAFTENGTKYYAWFEVAKAFAKKGYVPICMLINSKYFGVAQNRPRYIMIAFRLDVFNKLYSKYPENEVLMNVDKFMFKIRNKKPVNTKDLRYYDIEKDSKLFDDNILPKPVSLEMGKWHSVSEAIDDLSVSGSSVKSKYVKEINQLFKTKAKNINGLHNHIIRSHSKKIKDRFLFYQLLNFSKAQKETILKEKIKGKVISNGVIENVYQELKSTISYFNKLFKSELEFKAFINNVELTKKHSQRALKSENPSPAQLTIPDDNCHYSPYENRVLTVREIARIQSFPDSFIFCSKETTGGKNRSYEVPQYTQVGNAVPPKMAFKLGEHVINLLEKINE